MKKERDFEEESAVEISVDIVVEGVCEVDKEAGKVSVVETVVTLAVDGEVEYAVDILVDSTAVVVKVDVETIDEVSVEILAAAAGHIGLGTLTPGILGAFEKR